MKLFTIGYEGWQVDEFVRYLAAKKIGQVADVRKNPISRKKGFSKNKLAEKLAEKKIKYIHLAALGVPSAWRKLAKSKFITRQKMFADYVERILPKCASEIDGLLNLAKTNDLALLCFERDASDCHRHYVAIEMASRVNESRINKKKAAERRAKQKIIICHLAGMHKK